MAFSRFRASHPPRIRQVGDHARPFRILGDQPFRNLIPGIPSRPDQALEMPRLLLQCVDPVQGVLERYLLVRGRVPSNGGMPEPNVSKSRRHNG